MSHKRKKGAETVRSGLTGAKAYDEGLRQNAADSGGGKAKN